MSIKIVMRKAEHWQMKNRSNDKKPQLIKNVGISILAQAVSLVVSILINLIVPILIDEYQYSYWQTYVLYIGYVGIFHFGVFDGIMLRYSQYDYEQLNKKRIRSQLYLLLIIDSLLALVVLVGSQFIFKNGIYKNISVFVAIGIITKNLYTYATYTYQMTNRIKSYVKLVIVQRIYYALGILILMLLRVNNFYLYCLVDITADLFAILLLFRGNKELYFGKPEGKNDIEREFKTNISAGVVLLLANWVAMFLVGEAKMMIHSNWDILIFGKVSFAFSVSNLFLTFVTAISIVLFPSLKRMNANELPVLYVKIREAMSPVLFGIMLFYFPGCGILRLWIPKYSQSLVYLGILLPVIVFSSKVSLLTNNYLKAYRKEKEMLKINVISIAIASIMYCISIYILNNIYLLLVCAVLAIMLRSILSEIVVSKIIDASFVRKYVEEGIMTVAFILIASLLDTLLGFLVYAIVLLIYMYMNREALNKMIKGIKSKRQN